jgi:hypothetical protein
MIYGSSNEHPNKLARVGDLLREEFQIATKPLVADYFFAGNGKTVGIEVKWSVSDLLGSLQVQGEAGGPRLAVEMKKLLVQVDIPILLIPSIQMRGDGKVLYEGRVSGWSYPSVKGILFDLHLYGCIIDEWDGDIASRIAQIYYAVRSEGHDWIRQLGRPDFVSLDPTYTAAVWALSSYPGVGPVAAQKLLARFKSVEGVVQADLKSLTTVKGIGPKVAKVVYEGVRQTWR